MTKIRRVYGVTTLAILTAPLLCHAQGIVTTVAGAGVDSSGGDGGPATDAWFIVSTASVDTAGNFYIADSVNARIRKVTTDGIINTVAGNGMLELAGFGSDIGDGGPATSAMLNNPQGVAVDSAGNLYIADTRNNRIRMVDSNGIITTVVGSGRGANLGPYYPSGDGGPATAADLTADDVAVDSAGNIYIAGVSRIRKVTGSKQ